MQLCLWHFCCQATADNSLISIFIYVWRWLKSHCPLWSMDHEAKSISTNFIKLALQGVKVLWSFKLNFQLKSMKNLEQVQAWPGIISWPLHYWLQGKLYPISRLWKKNYFGLQDPHSLELFAWVYNVSTPKLTLSDGLSSSANFLPQMLLPLLPVPVFNNKL